MATAAELHPLTADEFLRIIFEPDMKVELDEGVVRMMTGGSRAHARVQGNVLVWLANALRGSRCGAFGPDMAVKTGETSVRYPDVSVDCGGAVADDDDLTLRDPRVVVEVLSPGTRYSDEGVKLREYRALRSVDTIALIDPLEETIRLFQRNADGVWGDGQAERVADLPLPSLNLVIPHAEIFARD